MTEREYKYLSDILIAIKDISLFLKGYSFENYIDDYEKQAAVERKLSIIGEAVNRFTQFNTEDVFKDAPKIVAFRNILIHAYASVDHYQVWQIIQDNLPPLQSKAEELLKDYR